MAQNKNPYRHSKILLVEDEDSLAIGLTYNLKAEGYTVTRAADGIKAREWIEKQEFDLIILDIMLPYIDGFELARLIRQRTPQLPILILTARTAIKDRLKGLEMGADDYLMKPFHLEELMLRIQGMLKRKHWYYNSAVSTPVFRFGQNKINFENCTAEIRGEKIQLTLREAMVMKYLIQQKNKIVTRRDILEHVWKISSEIETRTVDNFIARLRKYFESNADKPVFIKSIRGAGYMFVD